ncbi:hypothetical protein FKQ51_31485 [Bacillus toyonensis]|uniref:hypothetical protein n=1 Tax=Bacillus toyonensis TaxID=155322 RepID=UPI00270CF2A7|nr:hypothetical protein [Bacillus toyonensis]MDO8161696.1 hypothetical protein [Bacillus toyonensis]
MEETIRELLKSFPTDYPVDNVLVSGFPLGTTNFINLQGELAYFRNGTEIRVVKISKIDVVDF